MSRWRELARHLKEQEGVRDDRDIRDDSPDPPANVPIVPNVPDTLSHSAHAIAAERARWLAALAALDPSRPPAGIASDWWRTVLADATWIAINHAEAAAAFGWSASDLFGIRPEWGPGHGGLADRLDGTRRLAFTASVAHWQSDDWEGWLWRRTLDSKPLLWEIKHGQASERGSRSAGGD